MKLYRGDSLPSSVIESGKCNRGRTFADYFCGNGLIAKFGDGGTNTLVDNKDLLQLVIEHVGYDRRSPEAEVAYHSPMLSFSSSLECARLFCERNEKKRMSLEECPFEEATHFIWELDVEPDVDLVPHESLGVFTLTYESDPIHCKGIVEKQIARGYQEEGETGNADILAAAIGQLLAQAHAKADKSQHLALIVDVVKYLGGQALAGMLAGRNERFVNNARERALRDSEWLLYPIDPMRGVGGFLAGC